MRLDWLIPDGLPLIGPKPDTPSSGAEGCNQKEKSDPGGVGRGGGGATVIA